MRRLKRQSTQNDYLRFHLSPVPPLSMHSKPSSHKKNPSLKLGSFSPTKDSKISFEDFWSNIMKAKLLKLKRRESTEIILNDDCFTTKSGEKPFPVLNEKFKRSNLLYNPSGMISKNQKNQHFDAIEKIIDGCDFVRKTTRKLSHEIFTSKNSIKQEYLSFSKNIYK